jgi:transposase-like protein
MRWASYFTVDQAVQTVDFMVGDVFVECGQKLFRRAVKHRDLSPETIALDGMLLLQDAAHEVKAEGLSAEDTKARSSKYSNNLVEWDRRNLRFGKHDARL